MLDEEACSPFEDVAPRVVAKAWLSPGFFPPFPAPKAAPWVLQEGFCHILVLPLELTCSATTSVVTAEAFQCTANVPLMSLRTVQTHMALLSTTSVFFSARHTSSRPWEVTVTAGSKDTLRSLRKSSYGFQIQQLRVRG